MFNLLNLTPEQRDMLLGMGAGLLSGGRNNGEAISRGLLGGAQMRNEGMERRDRQKSNEQERLYRQQQMDEQARQRQEMQQIRGLAGQAFGPNPNLVQNDDMGNAMPQAPGGGGMPEFAQGLMRINPMMGAQFMPKPKAPMVLSKGARAFDESGKEVAANPEQEKPAIREVKTGNKIFTYELRGGEWKKIAEAPLYKPDGPEKPEKAPPGYRWAGDGLQPIPGGPADTKAGEKAEALAKRESGALARADFVLSKISEAKDAAGGMTTTGILGGVTRGIPGSPAYQLNRVLDPIKANIGFAELQAMREASPTGGALGQVAVQELNMLQSVLGSLDNAQSEEQLRGALDSIEKHFTNWKRVVQQARKGGGAGGATGGWSAREIK